MGKRHVISFLGLLIPAACTVKRDAFLNRNYQRMVTHYNVLFNGTERLKKGAQRRRDAYRDDYTKRLKLLPYKPQRETGVIPMFGGSSGIRRSGSLTIAEEKAQRAIDDHSMYIKEAERNAMIDDAYMALGKARYFQNKPIAALEAFDYIKTFIRGGIALSMRCSGRPKPICWPAMHTRLWITSMYQPAVSELEDLLRRSPAADLKPQLYYNLYKAYEGLNDSARAKKYKALAMAFHYGKRRAGAAPQRLQTTTPAAASWYAKAWHAYEQQQYHLSERYAKQGQKRFQNQPIMAKFRLLQALSLARQQRPKAYVKLLDSTIAAFAGTREADKAKALKKAAARILNSDKDDKQKDGS